MKQKIPIHFTLLLLSAASLSHGAINHRPTDGRPGDEQIWDIANTIRIAELDGAPLLYGVATDDSHTYHGGDVRPGRGWIMVKATALEGDAIVHAMRAGDFYSSSGVTIKSESYDQASRTWEIEIATDGEAKFTTELIGARSGYDATAELGKSGIGEVFQSVEGTTVKFVIPEDALFARVAITSDQAHLDPSFPNQKKQAWLQPIRIAADQP